MEFTDFSQKQELVEKGLRRFFKEPFFNCPNYSSILSEAMRYSLFAGGKRFRSVLLLLCFEAFEQNFERALPSACAVEYIHTYSLIHDDLPAIDDDDLRRGKLTCHKKFGEAIAILAGDALFAEAFNLMACYQEADASITKEIIKELALATGACGMVGGQVADVNLSGVEASKEELEFIHSHKTGKLIVGAAKIGARLANANEVELKVITDYAYHLGMAFQITDDILDEVGKTEVIGKNAGSDRGLKKATYVSIYGLEKAKKKADESKRLAIDSLNGINSKKLMDLARFVVARSK